MCLSSQESILCFGTAPVILSTTSPFLNRIRAGIPLIPNLPEVSGLTSVFTFAIVISLSSAICDRTGPTILQGPHHGAQKSASTHSSLLVITSKSASPVSTTLPIDLSNQLHPINMCVGVETFSEGIENHPPFPIDRKYADHT